MDKLAVTVVFLHQTQPNGRFGTGFFVTPDGKNMFLVTAEHVSSVLQGSFRATLSGINDTPVEVSSEDLTGAKNVTWISNGKEDVAVAWLHPSGIASAMLNGRFLGSASISSDSTAPSRDRTLTTLGFPLALGVYEHFSPITRSRSPPVGSLRCPGLIHTLSPRFFSWTAPQLEASAAPRCSWLQRPLRSPVD